MLPVLFSGSSNRPLAQAVASEGGLALGACRTEWFPDGEIHVELRDPVRDRAVFILQSTAPDVSEHLLELLLMADACWRGGAARLTAVIPYFAYGRQDRRVQAGEAVGARLVADLLVTSGFDQCLAVDLHNAALEGCFDVPVLQLSAVPLLVEAMRPWVARGQVVVAPDLGAAKLAERYGEALDLPVALVHKQRLTGSTVIARGTVGEVRGNRAILVDDMISTGSTIEAAARALIEAGCNEEIDVVATHGLLVGDAVQRLARLHIRRLLLTDSVFRSFAACPLPVQVVSLAPLLAAAMR